MKIVAVTGGAGFIGTNLVRRLIERGYQVKVIDDFSSGLRENLENLQCEIIQTSITELGTLKNALKDCNYIFHLAARGSVPRSLKNPRATIEVNMTGTLNVLECARDCGATVAYASSSSVYGSNLELPKKEKMWTLPLTPYAASKMAAESMVHSFAISYNIRAINYRFFNVFGPWQRPDHDYAAVIPRWIWKLINGQNDIEVFGDGSQSRDFTYIDSVIEILVTGLESNIVHPQPLNLAFGNCISLNSIIEILRKHFPNIEPKYSEVRQGDIKNSQNDPSELKLFFPEIENLDFDSAISETVAWYRENGKMIANGPTIRD